VLRLNVGRRRVTVHAHDARFNQPNDLALRKDGVLFASDPNWANGTGQLWRVDADGHATRLLDSLGTTNGIALSPDERVLYVGESVQRRIWAFDVNKQGAVSNRREFATFPDYGLDGIKCDAAGRLYVTRYGKGTIAILDPGGRPVREVSLGGKSVSNLVFGGPDGRSVFVTLQGHARDGTIRRRPAGRPVCGQPPIEHGSLTIGRPVIGLQTPGSRTSRSAPAQRGHGIP
jgi:gluconolactonase